MGLVAHRPGDGGRASLGTTAARMIPVGVGPRRCRPPRERFPRAASSHLARGRPACRTSRSRLLAARGRPAVCPCRGSISEAPVAADEPSSDPAELAALVGNYRFVSPGYLRTLGMVLARGRFFTSGTAPRHRADGVEAPGPEQDPIGQRFVRGNSPGRPSQRGGRRGLRRKDSRARRRPRSRRLPPSEQRARARGRAGGPRSAGSRWPSASPAYRARARVRIAGGRPLWLCRGRYGDAGSVRVQRTGRR